MDTNNYPSLLMSEANMSVQEIDFPAGTSINGKEINPHFKDAFEVVVSKPNLDAKYVYHAIFGFIPTPVRWALNLRNSIVKWFGFSAANVEMSLPLEEIESGKQAGFLTIELVTQNEVVCGAYEANMDMWLSVFRQSDNTFCVSTLVNLKTRSGVIYMALIKPFHKIVAKYCIRQAIKAGRI
ncbi:DUF2867 domain-containing protein [Enterovibrio paralichthyis]|uniref:DUF2867 domain-containing protein n=1 Tax=Enterovibrio paralichthyis TaxID=2853805 RepID=UPI0021041A5B|nr:DUF2867 domain-containing protein [Enterovibrio paralichthyis]